MTKPKLIPSLTLIEKEVANIKALDSGSNDEITGWHMTFSLGVLKEHHETLTYLLHLEERIETLEKLLKLKTN